MDKSRDALRQLDCRPTRQSPGRSSRDRDCDAWHWQRLGVLCSLESMYKLDIPVMQPPRSSMILSTQSVAMKLHLRTLSKVCPRVHRMVRLSCGRSSTALTIAAVTVRAVNRRARPREIYWCIASKNRIPVKYWRKPQGVNTGPVGVATFEQHRGCPPCQILLSPILKG